MSNLHNNKPFTYASLFSGIGGFEQALNKLGGICVFASEIDKFAAKAYETLYGHKPAGDITKIDAKDIPEHDLLVAGFPCQAFSVAGKRKGFEDTRGTLFFEIARIAKEKRPKAMLLENVKGLVNHRKGETLDIMISVLNEIGYVIDFEILNSKYFGVPQNRERIFIVAIREDLIEAEPFNKDSLKGNTIVRKRKRQINEWAKTFNFEWPEQGEVTTRLRDILETNVDEKYYLSDDKTAKLVAQLESQEPSVTDEIKCYNPRNIDDGTQTRMQDRVYDPEGSAVALTSFCDRLNILDSPQMLGHIDMKGHDAIKRVYSADGVSPTLTTMGGGHREPKIAVQTPIQYNRKDGIGKELELANTLSASDWRGLNRNQNQTAIIETIGGGHREPKIAERQTVIDDTQGFDGVRTYDDETPTIRSERHGLKIAEEIRPVLTPDRMEKRQNGRRFKEDGEEMFTLTAQDRHGIALREIIEESVREIASKSRPNEEIEINFKENGDIRPHRTDARKSGLSELNINHEGNPSFTVSAAHPPKVYGNKTRFRIRKLTPLECWRLQGFPDEAHEAVKAAGISDNQRYKQAGNAVTVNVIEAIGKKLIPLIHKLY